MLKVENLTVKRGYNTAVDGIDIKVEKGSVVGLIGVNGAGKSSTLGSIAGLYKNLKGDIIFEGKKISNLSPDRRVKSGLILVPEGRLVFPNMTIKDNLEMGYIYNQNRNGFAQMLEMVYEWFPKLKTRSTQLSGTLSGGEQQMLAIGRGLMRNPSIMMLDEPSLGLAPIIIDEVEKVIMKLKEEGITVLLAEQNANLVFNVCDYIYVLETGKVKLEGGSKEMQSDRIVKSLFMGE